MPHPVSWKPLAAAAALGLTGALTACTDYGGGGRVALGYDAAWGDPYWGWYGDYYYPGSGVYVYDAHRRAIPWTDAQRGYWEGRRNGWRGDHGRMNPNWHDFRRRPR